MKHLAIRNVGRRTKAVVAVVSSVAAVVAAVGVVPSLAGWTHTEVENGKLKRWTKVKFDGQVYHVESYHGDTRTFKEPPVCCDVKIYFTDLKDIKQVFYISEANFYQPQSTGANSFEFKSSDGHRNVFFFEKGRIKNMEFHLSLATVYMNRIAN